MDKLFTSESVSQGHPDRLCDTIGNTILTEILKRDKKAHVGIEALATKNFFVLSGEVSSTYTPDYEGIARTVAKDIGYNKPGLGFNGGDFVFINKVNTQSPDIAQGVNLKDGVIGAGDQGIIFGFACDETPEYYPLAATIANALTTRYQEYIEGDPNLRPDAKSQVTINYTTGKVVTIVFAASHIEEASQEYVRKVVKENVIIPVLNKLVGPDAYKGAKLIINSTGKFSICGPAGDAGVIGRKLVVDSYGGYAPLGGGCTNAKDPSKVDASAARAARHAAKNLVAAGICKRVEIQLAYAIGVAAPVSISVDTKGTGITSDETIAGILSEVYNFEPAAIIKNLHLVETDYSVITRTGQFGVPASRDSRTGLYLYPWEELNLVDDFKKAFANVEKVSPAKPVEGNNEELESLKMANEELKTEVANCKKTLDEKLAEDLKLIKEKDKEIASLKKDNLKAIEEKDKEIEVLKEVLKAETARLQRKGKQ